MNEKIPIILEGGVRKGSDIFKAIARGAKCVIIDKPLKWGSVYDVSNIDFLIVGNRSVSI